MEYYQFPSLPILLTFLVFVFMILKFLKTWKTSNPPPGPWKLPLIGNIHQLGSLPHRRLRDLANKFGPMMHLQVGQVSHIVVSSPETAKEIMKIHDINFADRPRLYILKFYNHTDIAFSPYGNYYRQMRKICSLELLSPKRVQSFRSIREEEVSNFVRSISSNAGSSINLTKMLYSLTNDIIARAAFGKKCKDKEAFIQVALKIVELGAGFNIPDVFPSNKLVEVLSACGMLSELDKYFPQGDKILDNIIHEHRASKAIGKTTDVAGEAEEDLLHVLLNIMDQGNLEVPLTAENIKAVILDLFIAGTETSTTTLEWVISELLVNPRVLAKAQAEVRQIFDRKGNVVDESGLHELEYLKLVIKETLRLRPALPLVVPRECRESCKINGYDIPVGTRIIVNAWAMGRDPNYWTEPELFYPERFLGSSIDYKGANFEFIPFGSGRRMCPGLSFGIANVELPIANLLYHFNWKLPNGTKNEDLDMTESFGATVKRKNDIYFIPTLYHPPPPPPPPPSM
ncbi:hypothetical protein Ddye_003996 [Dipteronia dyeriana]|uniref:Cytochrome P450 n=1 Tax=Dipteronia dyeriana TaxID=168575 RepID=A0AAD9XTU5_9ROSI|nr:hypothetical protein Ddye_003996 [Dipteronia dyeriana]